MPIRPSPVPDPGQDPSHRRLATGAGALLAGRIITAACGLVQIPLVLAHLGQEAFGVWMVLTGCLWTLGILDFGVGFAVQNKLTACLSLQHTKEAAALVCRARRTLILIGAVVATIGLAASWAFPWADLLGVTDPGLRLRVPGTVAIMFSAAALNIPLTLGTRAAAAAQQIWLTGIWTAAGSLLGLGAVALAGWWGSNVTGFMLAACVLPLLPGAGTWLSLWRRFPWSRPVTAPAAFPPGLWRDSGLFFLPQLGSAINGTFLPMLVAVFAGPLAAGTFGVLQRIFGFGLQIQNLTLMPAWPAYSHAAARGDLAFVRKTYRMSWWLTLGLFVAPLVLATAWIPAVVQLWLGADAPVISPALLWAVSGWYVLQLCGQPIAMVLNGVGRMESLAVLGWAGLFLALALCSVLGPRWGALGVVAAMAAPYAALHLPFTAWQAHRILKTLHAAPPAVAASPCAGT
jgi:O-antigen/teichoic acid export membrane protein